MALALAKRQHEPGDLGQLIGLIPVIDPFIVVAALKSELDLEHRDLARQDDGMLVSGNYVCLEQRCLAQNKLVVA
jgi:hypothetical protein